MESKKNSRRFLPCCTLFLLVSSAVCLFCCVAYQLSALNLFEDDLPDSPHSHANFDAHADLRTSLLYLLQTLPNNTTQRAVSHATVRRIQPESALAITLTTQGGVDKLPRLLDLVIRWQAPISCALLITTENQLDEWLKFMQKHDDILNKHVSFHILVEQPQLPSNINLHPVNALRNLALHNADTPYVFLNDIDFMPSIDSHNQIAAMLNKLPPNVLWILPAFERFHPLDKQMTVNDLNLIPKNKPDLLRAIGGKEVAPFHEHFKWGHGPTNFAKWYNATELYDAHYKKWFEPYVVAHKAGLPDFYSDFRGFGFNKLVFFIEAHYAGYKFQVLPGQFVVHMNHPGRLGRQAQRETHRVYERFRGYMRGRYGLTDDQTKGW